MSPAIPDTARQVRLEARGVVKVLSGLRVLRGVRAEFSGSPGLHVIEGANGSGKTTLLGVLGGRVKPSVGKAILFAGDDAVAEGEGLRRWVGWLGHELGLYLDLDAVENVGLHARLRGLDAEEEWLAGAQPLGIERLAHRRVRTLSRGQRQAVALVRAMVGRPAVLLLDEPSTGLDAGGCARLAAFLQAATARGTLVIAITHDATLREALRGRIWGLRHGELFEDLNPTPPQASPTVPPKV